MRITARTTVLLLGVGAVTALGIAVAPIRRRKSETDFAGPRPFEPWTQTAMKQLSSLDTQYLALESPRQTGHFGALSICEPCTAHAQILTAASMTELVRERMHLASPLRWRLVPVPLGLDYPYFVDHEHIDLSYHVREAAVPSPGDDHQLAALVARLHARPLDRTRPLWEMYVISGLSSGRVAIYTKIHHALADGVSMTEIIGQLLDASPQSQPVIPAHSIDPQRDLLRSAPSSRTGIPSRSEMWGRGFWGVSRHPGRMLRSFPRALPNLEETSVGGVPGAARLGRLASRSGTAMSPALKAPKTPFSTKISPHRRLAFGNLDLNRVKEVKRAYQVTVNDVVVSICAGAVRRWLLDHKELPNEPLVAQVPVSVRGDEHVGTYGNRIQTQAVALHTEIADPVVRLRETAASLLRMKERGRALPPDLLADTNHLVPPSLAALAARATFALATSAVGRPTWNLVVSNVPGPQIPLYCNGMQLVAHYPLSLITDGMGLNITVMSYDGHLDFGIVADREQMPDVWTLIEGLELSLSELENATTSVQ